METPWASRPKAVWLYYIKIQNKTLTLNTTSEFKLNIINSKRGRSHSQDYLVMLEIKGN